MSTELIGNGNFPCVYTENILAVEADKSIKIDCKIPEMRTNDGLFLWSNVELIQNPNIKLYSFIVYNRNFELSQFIDYHNQNIINPSILSSRSISLNEISGLKQKNSPMTDFIAPAGDTFFYEHSFEHDQIDFKQDNIYVITFISYNIEIDTDTNILPNKYDFFGGPVNIDIVKEAGKYALASQIYYSNGELYKGAIHKMNNGAMAGAVHSDGGEILNKENNSYNPKLCIIRDYDAYNDKSLQVSFISESQYALAISKPMWSFYYDKQSNRVRVRCIFKINSVDLSPLVLGPLASYNYKKIKDKMIVFLKIGKERLDITSPLRKIKINHGDSLTNSQEFFEIEAEIPNNYSTESVELLIEAPIINLGATEVMDILCNNADSIRSNFLLGSNSQHDKEFIKKFLLLLSINKNITLSKLETEKNILLNNMSGPVTQKYRDFMAELFSTQYADVMSKLQPLVSSQELFSKSFVSNPRNFVRIRNNYYPQYFDQSGEPQQGGHLGKGNGKNYITIIDLQKRLLEESNRVVDRIATNRHWETAASTMENT